MVWCTRRVSNRRQCPSLAASREISPVTVAMSVVVAVHSLDPEEVIVHDVRRERDDCNAKSWEHVPARAR